MFSSARVRCSWPWRHSSPTGAAIPSAPHRRGGSYPSAAAGRTPLPRRVIPLCRGGSYPSAAAGRTPLPRRAGPVAAVAPVTRLPRCARAPPPSAGARGGARRRAPIGRGRSRGPRSAACADLWGGGGSGTPPWGGGPTARRRPVPGGTVCGRPQPHCARRSPSRSAPAPRHGAPRHGARFPPVVPCCGPFREADGPRRAAGHQAPSARLGLPGRTTNSALLQSGRCCRPGPAP